MGSSRNHQRPSNPSCTHVGHVPARSRAHTQLLESPYYVSLIEPFTFTQLVCELISIIDIKTGRERCVFAASLRLLLLNSEYDLHSLMSSVFDFFGRWCKVHPVRRLLGHVGVSTRDSQFCVPPLCPTS